MNDLERRSFYSFLSLYVISSFLLISLVAYLYYNSQKQSMQTQLHYKLEHIADKESSKIISAHMNGYMFTYIPPQEDVKVTMLDMNGDVIFGENNKSLSKYIPGYYHTDALTILVSDATRGHLNIDRIVVYTDSLTTEIEMLKKGILQVLLIVMFLVLVIAWGLSWIFIKPIRKRVSQIERFVNDITHELNTPITSLKMATDQALKAGICSTKSLNNISISTKQLHDIYRSLVYLNFSHKDSTNESIDIAKVLNKSIEYYQPLADIKRVSFEININSHPYLIAEQKASLLFNNLIGNAIKYSPAKSTIHITLTNGMVSIKDEGIGIEKEKQQEIFEKFQRGTKLSGGFGVGLSIVKSICQEYAINIQLNSAPQKGSEFILKF